MSSSSRAGMAVGVQDKKLFPLFSRQPSKQAQRGEAEQVPAAASGSESVAQASASGQTRPTSAHKAEASSIEAGPSLPSSRSMDGHDGRMSQDSLQKARAASSTPINASSARLRSRTPPVKPKPPRPAEVIEIPDSPDKEASPKLKTLADFAAERKAKAKARKPIIQQEPLWPSSTTIHVRAVRNEPLQMSSVPPFDYKGKGRALDLDDHQLAISYGSSYVPPALLSIMHNPSSTSIEAANSKQARTAIPADSGGPATTEVWPVHYAPKRCDDVLGAQAKSNTQYLRTWLEALSVEDTGQGGWDATGARSAKRKVRREVTKRDRKRFKRNARRGNRRNAGYSDDVDDLQDFIADDDEEEYEEPECCHDWQSVVSGSSSPVKDGQAVSDPLPFEQLSNLLVLTGPTASGKTTSIYAAAQELGWEVFEVYPGIGRRGGKDLERYVGMVGDNHLVSRTRTNGEIDKATASSAEKFNGANAAEGSKYRQSLILMEEVDILYASDAGFWEGLTSLVAKSRRPVVLTCNDAWTIPQHLLPIQAILHYPQLDSAQIHSRCDEVACAEMAHDVLTTKAGSDLRQALLQMQGGFLPFTSLKQSLPPDRDTPSCAAPLVSMAQSLENASFADSQFSAASLSYKQEELAPFEPEDITMSHPDRPAHILQHAVDLPSGRHLPSYARHQEFLELLFGAAEDAATDITPSYHSADDLSAIVDLFATQYGSQAFLVDYLPYIREVTMIDDYQEALYREIQQLEDEDAVVDSRVRRSRRLAGGGREPYRRYLEVDGDALRMLREGILSS